MFSKITKIMFASWEKYFVFIFLSVFLSLFSYILGNNIVLSVQDYLQSQIKPLVGWDIVISNKNDLDENLLRKKYKTTFDIAKIISMNSTLFDTQKQSSLVELVYHTSNYPFYNQFTYETIDMSGILVVNRQTFEKYGKTIEILGKKYQVKWIIKKSPLWDISIYASQNTLYLPIENFDTSLNSTNSRLQYTYFLKFQWMYEEIYKNFLKSDPILKDFTVKTLSDRNETISNITDRFYVFINFFHLVVFALTFFIVILSLETFFKKIKGTIGLLNIFWLKKKQIFYYNVFILFWVFFWSFLLAYTFNIFLMELLSTKYDFFASNIESFYRGFFITVILLFVWVFSPAYKIFKSDIGSLLKDEGNFSNFTCKDYGVYLFLIFSWFLAINIVSGIKILDSFLYSVIFILLIVIFYILIEKILNLWFQWYTKQKIFFKNFYLFDAIRSTIKPGNVSFLIIFSSVISFVSIFIFYVFSGSFLNYLKNITMNSNDTFIINIQSHDKEVIKKYFTHEEIFEIVSLKIKKINRKTLEEFLWTKTISREFGREFFSTTKYLENKIISGRILSAGWVSVDREFAQRLWLRIWDEIIFWVAGLEKELKVVNFREAVRNGANPFFYFQLFVSDFEKYPRNYIVSYKQSQKPNNIESTLFKEIGNYVTVIKTKDIIDIVIEIAYQILVIVYFCLGYIFIFSFLSFIVSLSFLSTFKRKKVELLHIFWWKRKKLIQALGIEFVYLIGIGLILSFVFGSIFLWIIFYFIKYFSLNIWAFAIWILIIFWLFIIMWIYVKIFLKKSLQIK